MERFFVDERGGCIAARDRELTDPEYPGLHPDTDGVVEFWGGKQITKKCPTCGHVSFSHWEIADEDRKAAHELCEKLNKEPEMIGYIDRLEMIRGLL